MGGLWVDFERAQNGSLVPGSPRNQATSIPGLYACGEVDYQYHGANRLGANSLLSCIYGGMVAGPALASYRKNLDKSSYDISSSVFDKAEKRAQAKYDAILKMDGPENPYRLHEELAQTMLRDCTIERHNGTLDKVLAKIEEIDQRSRNAGVTDTATGRMNQGSQFMRHLFNMIVLARVIAQGARNRNESRGAHYKPDFKERDDANWLRTTLAFHSAPANGGNATIRYVREFDYAVCGVNTHITDAVDVSLVRPRPRRYEQAGAASATATAAKGANSDATQSTPGE
jgi:succinate dehydrogenase / fumarate reductase flavoprotein subunit